MTLIQVMWLQDFSKDGWLPVGGDLINSGCMQRPVPVQVLQSSHQGLYLHTGRADNNRDHIAAPDNDTDNRGNALSPIIPSEVRQYLNG